MHLFWIKSNSNLLVLLLLSVNECKITQDCTSNRITENHFRNVMKLSGTYSKISQVLLIDTTIGSRKQLAKIVDSKLHQR